MRIIPFWKFGKRGDRFWWMDFQRGGDTFRITYLLGISSTRSKRYHGAIYKLYLGPLVLGVAINVRLR